MAEDAARPLGEPPRKVVVIQTAFVGDVVFTSPLIHAIRQAHPQAEIALMVRPDKAEVAACIPGVNTVLTYDKRGHEVGPIGLFKAARKLRRGEFDLLVAPHRSARTALLAKLSGIPNRVGFKSGFGKLCYTSQVPRKRSEPCNLVQELGLLRQVGIEPAGTKLRLKAPLEQKTYLKGFYRDNGLPDDAKLVALCIGSLWPTKRWPAVYFASLVESLKERGYSPILFGSRSERKIARQIESLVRERLAGQEGSPDGSGPAAGIYNCVGNTLAESAALLARCEMSVGGDTGLVHMSRALGIPTALIYGPTDPRQHCFSEHDRVLVARVKCRPCSRHGQNKCPEQHHDCMRLVSPDQVMDAFREIANLQTPVPPTEREQPSDSPSTGDGLPLG